MAHGVFNTASGAIPFVGPPGIPSNLIAVAVGRNRIDLTWELATTRPREQGVRVEMGTDGATFPVLTDLPAGSESYSRTDLTADVRYYFRVRALGTRIQSDPSDTANAKTAAEDAPVAGFTVNGPTTVTEGSSVQFTNTSANYTSSSWLVNGVEVSTLDSPSIPFDTPGTFSVTLTVTGPGGSDTSGPTVVTVTALATPNVTGVAVSPNGTRWTITTDASVTGHTGFTPRDGSGNPLASFTYVSGEGSTSLLFDAPVSYQGAARTLDYTHGNVVHSATPMAAFTGFTVDNQSTQQPVDPTTPTVVSVVVGDTGNVVTLTGSEALTGYSGFTLTASGGPVSLAPLAGAGTSVLHYGPSRTILEGESLTYTVAPGGIVDSDGHPLPATSGGSVDNQSTATASAPGQPTNLGGRAGSDTEITLAWDLADGSDTAVELQRSASGADTYSTIVTLAGGTRNFTDRSCYPVTSYDYRVRARNVIGDSAWSATASVTTKVSSATAENALSNFSVTANSAWQITVAWHTPSTVTGGASKIEIERSTDGGVTYSVVKVYASTANANVTWADTPLDPGVTYTYRIRGRGEVKYSDYTSPLSATTDALTAGYPGNPLSLSATVLSATQTALSWLTNSDGTEVYEAETAPVPQGGSVAVDLTALSWSPVGTTAAGASVFTLTTVAKTPVFVRVRANRSGNRSAYTYYLSPKDNLTLIPVRPCSAGTAQTYDIGPGQAYTSFAAFFAAVGSAGVGPGSVINVHYATYDEKFTIPWRGRRDARITLVGIPDGSGNLPTIELNGAVTPSGLTPNGGTNYADPTNNYQFFSGILFNRLSSDPVGHTPGFVTFKGIRVQYTGAGGGTFTAADGSTRTYVNGGGRPRAIYITGGDGLTLGPDEAGIEVGNIITGGSDGVFAADNGAPNKQIHDLTLRNNRLYGNGAENNFGVHDSYIETQDCYYEGNYYGPLRVLAQGGGLKDRGVGTVIKANKFDGTIIQIGLVEHQNSVFTSWIASRERRQCYVAGNLLINDASLNYFCQFRCGGDQGFGQGYRKGDEVYSHNTSVDVMDSASRTTWAQVYDAARAFVAVNNVRYVSKATSGGSTPGNVLTNVADGVHVYGANWLSPNPVDLWTGTFTGIKQGYSSTIVSATNNPAFISGSRRILAGTEADGRGTRLTDDHPAVDREFDEARGYGTAARAAWGAGSDLGAFTAGPDTTPPTVVSRTIDQYGQLLTRVFSERVSFTTAGYTLSATGGALTETYVSGDGTDTVVTSLSRVVIQSETVTDSYSSATGNTADLATVPNPLATYSSQPVTNSSQETSGTGTGVRSVTTAAPSGSVSSVTLSQPTGLEDGDLLVLAVYGYGTFVPTLPSGFTLVELGAQDYQADGNNAGRLYVARKTVSDAASEPSTYTATFTATYVMAYLARVVGFPTVNAAAKAAGTNVLTQTSPSATTSVDGCLDMRVLAVDRNFDVTAPDGYVRKVHLTAPMQFGGRLVLAVATQTTHGPTGAAVFTLVTARPSAMVTAALAPA